MTELTKSEKAIITKYDLYFEGRLSKLEMISHEMKSDISDIKSDLKEIRKNAKHDFFWLLSTIFIIASALGGMMAHGFKWF